MLEKNCINCSRLALAKSKRQLDGCLLFSPFVSNGNRESQSITKYERFLTPAPPNR